MIIHTVQRNETISQIAGRYGVSEDRIITDNGLFGLSGLVPGQALIILIPETVHTVQSGESIYSIARNYGLTVIELMQKNPELIYNQTIVPNQQITVRFRDEGTKMMNIYGYFYPYIEQAVLEKAAAFATSAAIFGYGFTEDGNLIEIDDTSAISTLYEYKAIPIMLLTSFTEEGSFSGERASLLFNDVNLQNKVIANMLEVMNERGYLGVDIDFEYVNAADNAAYVNFIRNVVSGLHRFGYSVNVDLAPKTSDNQPGLLYEGHDYAEIGRAADTVLLMTYEWGYTYGPPMAVAPLPNVRRVVEYAVTKINPRKIYMGIPNYGYDWKLPYERGVTEAVVVGNEEAIRIAAENGAEIQFDENVQTPFFEYYSRSDQSNHIVWFEDVRSIQAKFGLIEEFNLKGAGYWNFMKPFAQNFAFLSGNYDIMKNIR